MRILVVGAGSTGTGVIRQLKKNPSLEVVVADAREDPPAVREGVIESVDFNETLTPLNMEHLLLRAHADLVLIAASPKDFMDSRVPGAHVLASSLFEELASSSKWPLVRVCAD